MVSIGKNYLEDKNKGFSLVELVVVVVIIAILAGTTVLGVTSYIRKSRVATDIANAATIQDLASKELSNVEFVTKFAKTSTYYSNPEYEHCVFPYYFTWTDAIKFKSYSESESANIKHMTVLANKLAETFPDGLPESKTGDGFLFVLYFNCEDDLFEDIKCISLADTGVTADRIWSYHELIASRSGNPGTNISDWGVIDIVE